MQTNSADTCGETVRLGAVYVWQASNHYDAGVARLRRERL
jgi:hypothetical protein